MTNSCIFLLRNITENISHLFIRYECTSEISKYTDLYCEQNGPTTGCYWKDDFKQYLSCADICKTFYSFNDERRCNGYCPGGL